MSSSQYFIDWGEGLKIGVPKMDREHRRLIDLVNRMHRIVEAGGKYEAVCAVLSDLGNYTKYHFESEEAEMLNEGFPGLEAHRRTHEQLTEEVRLMGERFRAGEYEVAERLLAFLKDWAISHILHADASFGEHVAKKKATLAAV